MEAVSLYTGEHGFVSIRAFVVTADQAAGFRKAIEADALVPVKQADIEADAATFLSLFKRFNVMISRQGELDGREIDADD